jgi:hypothetical protein
VKAHNDGDSMTPHKTPLQLYQLNQLLRQARENATGWYFPAQFEGLSRVLPTAISVGTLQQTAEHPEVM